MKKRNILVRIPKREHRYRNTASGIIYYKKGDVKFSTGTNLITQADDYIEIELEKRKTGKSPEQIKKEKQGMLSPLFKDEWDEYVRLRGLSNLSSTMKTYDTSWKMAIGPFWHPDDGYEPKNKKIKVEKRTVAEINFENISKFKEWYLSEYPNGERLFDRAHVHFDSFVHHLVEKEVLKTLPKGLDQLNDIDDTVKKLRKYKKAGRLISEEETTGLLKACDDLKSEFLLEGLRARAWVLLAVKGGLRKTEAASLRWDKFNEKTGEIEVWCKNKYWRLVPLIPETIKTLKEIKQHTNESEWIFPMITDETKHTYGQLIDHTWNKIKRMAGIKGRLRFHDLRHTFATITGEEGWPVKMACDVLDMSVKIYEKVYCKPRPEKVADLMRLTFGKTKRSKK